VVGNTRQLERISDQLGQGPPIAGFYNLIGDDATSRGLVDGKNGNQVGNAKSRPLHTEDVVDSHLRYNGGQTPTHAPIVSGPAVDQIASHEPLEQLLADLAWATFTWNQLDRDQRGARRPAIVAGTPTQAWDVGAV